MNTLIRRIAVLVMLLSASAAIGASELSLWVARDVAPGPKIRLTINTKNVPVVHMSAYKLSNTLLLAASYSTTKPPRVNGLPIRSWDVSVSQKTDKPNPNQSDQYFSRQVNLPPLSPGFYLLVAKGGGQSAFALANITNLAVVAKRSSNRVLTWVCDAKTGQTIKGANVAVYAKGRKIVKQGSTDRDGVCMLSLAPSSSQQVLVTLKTDAAAVLCSIPGDDGKLVGHFQTDRPIYRPGQTMYYKVALRRTKGRLYTPVSNTGCEVEIRDSKDNVLLQKRIATNLIGTLAGEADIPDEGALGPYSIVVTIGKEKVYNTFSVAEYRKPEFKVDIEPADKKYMSGEEAVFNVEATYYFGAPLPQAKVVYRIRRNESPYDFSDDSVRWYRGGDGNLYSRDTYASSPFVAEGTVYTDDKGKVSIRFKTDKKAPDSNYSIQCTVIDASKRQVEASASVPTYRAAIRLGIHTKVIFTPLGTNIPVDLSAIDLDGKMTSASVTLEVKRPVWIEKESKYVYRTISTTHVSVPGSGKATAKVPAKAQGDLLITATASDRTGRVTTAETSVWVVDPRGTVGVENAEPSVDIKLDRLVYVPGGVVNAWITSNIPGRPMLVTAEGADIWSYAVVRPGKGGTPWILKTSVEMCPDAYIQAVQWSSNRLVSGNATVRIPDRSRRLTVTIQPERTSYKPGEKAVYIITTRDINGKPVSAEVGMAVVDEAIFALRPDDTIDPCIYFWGERDNKVVTQYSAPEELSGGAYQRVNALAPVRQRFMDTAYWNAHILTGNDGTARVELELPGNLTSWRATACAIDGETRVGVARASVQSSRPVMLRLSVPRQMVKGDDLQLVGTINNRTNQEHEFEVKLASDGIDIKEPATQRVRVPAEGEKTVRWQVIASEFHDAPVAVYGSVAAVDVTGDQKTELADALKSEVRVVPDGIEHRIGIGGILDREKTVTINLPSDRIEPASKVTIGIRKGVRQSADEMAKEVLLGGRYGSPGAADQLMVAPYAGLNSDSKDVRESLALLSRYQQSEGGWSWWEQETTSPDITAHVLISMARAHYAGLPVPAGLVQRGITGAVRQYEETNLWEYRALLASAISISGGKQAGKLLDEVKSRGTNLSPYSQLLLAEALAASGNRRDAIDLVDKVLQGVVAGPETTYVPIGDHPGWSASTVEATAQALCVLVELNRDSDLQSKLAQWLAAPEEIDYLSQDDKAAASRALFEYLKRKPESTNPGSIELIVNGKKLDRMGINTDAEFVIPRSDLKDGDNTISLRRIGGNGNVFFSVKARVYRRAMAESTEGIRVMRRYEVQNSAGMWSEVKGAINPSQPIRCTVLVWPDDRPDNIRVVEPIPAGFEFIDSDYTESCPREEVRDGAVIHYLKSEGQPEYFRYYLRAESSGKVRALPAYATAVRRPSVRANSAGISFEVKE